MPASPARSLATLADKGLLEITPELQEVADQFAVSITPAMLALIDADDPADPIAAQFVPSEKELETKAEELADPIGDHAHSPVEGIVHRYPDRVLLKLTLACPVYCRFCFRREQVGPEEGLLGAEAQVRALDYIRSHKEIWEVILTGGEPLLLSDRRLLEVITQLNEIDHVKVIRIHTRVPVVDPSRITPGLIKTLRGKKPVYIILHCNHARELTDTACAALARLADSGFPLLSQSVLLHGVNDDPTSLEKLMRTLVENRVKPHYLHHGDLARGTSHFRVPIEKGQSLLKHLRGRVSGLCQPTYMLDLPGGHGKAPIGPVFAVHDGEAWFIENFLGEWHSYKELP